MWAGRTHSANSPPFGDWDAEENRMDKGKEKKLGKDLVSDFFVKFQNVLGSRDLPPRPWTWAHPWCKLSDHRVQVWWRSSHLPVRRSDLRTKFRQICITIIFIPKMNFIYKLNHYGAKIHAKKVNYKMLSDVYSPQNGALCLSIWILFLHGCLTSNWRNI